MFRLAGHGWRAGLRLVWLGGALLLFDVSGKQLWHRDLGEHRHEWGYSAGPVLHDGLCYLNFGPGPRTALLAFDKLSGTEVWRHDPGPVKVTMPRNDGFGARDGVVGSWSVTLLIKSGEREELIMSWPEKVMGYAPRTGGFGSQAVSIPCLASEAAWFTYFRTMPMREVWFRELK